MFTIITDAELVIEFCFGQNQLVEIRKVFITQSAQAIRDGFCIRDFGANQPERVNERKTDKLFPLLTQIPKSKFPSVTLAKANGLIANQETRAMGCRQAAANSRLAACTPQNLTGGKTMQENARWRTSGRTFLI